MRQILPKYKFGRPGWTDIRFEFDQFEMLFAEALPNDKLKAYVRYSAALALAFLLCALASKAYHGLHWRFADAYLGDICIVACLYFLLTVLRYQWSWRLKAFTIGGIAVAVEAFQASGIPKAWDLPKPFLYILGSKFDATDFACYAFGLWCAYLCDRFLLKRLTH